MRPKDVVLDSEKPFNLSKGIKTYMAQKTMCPSKLFTFLPGKIVRCHMDNSLILAAIASEWGIYPAKYASLELLHIYTTFYIPKAEEVYYLLVLLKANGDRFCYADAMREHALNEKLQATYNWADYLLYSLRRTVVIESRRTEGAEAARELVNHRPGSGTI